MQLILRKKKYNYSIEPHCLRLIWNQNNKKNNFLYLRKKYPWNTIPKLSLTNKKSKKKGKAFKVKKKKKKFKK